jgi:hypothetical protein
MKLVRKFEEMGGIKYIHLTHKDNVAGSEQYANYFQAQRITHGLDSLSLKDVEIILSGSKNRDFGTMIYTPRHTHGHQVFYWIINTFYRRSFCLAQSSQPFWIVSGCLLGFMEKTNRVG